MKKNAWLYLPFFVLSTFIVSSAQAALIFSDISYTSNSISFSISGDMTGYSTPNSAYESQFGILYHGDIWNGSTGYASNSWSSSPFSNATTNSAGNTGDFGYSSPYTWSLFNGSLANAVASNTLITLTTGNFFDMSATSGSIEFVWGHQGGNPYTSLFKWEVGSSNASVDEPTPILLLGLGILGLAAARRKRK